MESFAVGMDFVEQEIEFIDDPEGGVHADRQIG
jgi:hypothetical protein